MRIAALSFLACLMVSPVVVAADDDLLVRQVALQHELSAAVAVRDAAHFRQYLAEHRGPTSPFHVLSSAALQRFTNSLVFNERGLASFDVTDLRRELTAAQVYAALRVFGVEDAALGVQGLRVSSQRDRLVANPQAINSGHHDMYCAGAGSCGPRIGWVCTSNC